MTMVTRAISSCLSQSLSGIDVEVVVVDDASTDKSVEVIQNFSSNIVLLELKNNYGVAKASNEGIKKSKGRYIIRVDSDDFLSKFACQIMYLFLESDQEYGFVYCDHIRIDVNGKREEYVRLDNKEMLLLHGAGIMFRKEALYEIGLYDEELRNAEDYDLLTRLINRNIKGYRLPLPLYRYHIHDNNITKDPSRQLSIEKVRARHKGASQ